MRQQPFEEQWEDIKEYFSWKDVYETMKALDWQWGTIEGIPNLNSLQDHAYELLCKAWEDGRHHSLGGFNAWIEEGCLALSFSVTEWICEPKT